MSNTMHKQQVHAAYSFTWLYLSDMNYIICTYVWCPPAFRGTLIYLKILFLFWELHITYLNSILSLSVNSSQILSRNIMFFLSLKRQTNQQRSKKSWSLIHAGHLYQSMSIRLPMGCGRYTQCPSAKETDSPSTRTYHL